MKTQFKYLPIFMLLLFPLLTFTGCRKEIRGCTDPYSFNYNSQANFDDGSCIAKVYGCTDPTSSNFNPYANINDGSCEYLGDVTFWYNSNGYNATVYVGGYVGYITSYYSSTYPTCGSNGCANFTLSVGTYYYTASSSNSSWEGYVTVTKNG